MMKKILFPFAMLLALGVALVPTGKQASADDFIDLDVSAVAPNLRGAFRQAEQFWETRINGYSASLPAAIRSQLTGRLQITANTGVVDGVGGTLGFAGPTDTAFFQTTIGNPANGNIRSTVVATAGQMTFDIADSTPGVQFSNTVLHEMGHVLGIGTLWDQNGVINVNNDDQNGLLQRRNGNLQYVGLNGIRGFRDQSGHHRANYVPVEQGGGPGTALGHWAGGTSPNWFFAPANGSRRELMTGFETGAPVFVSEASFGSLADLGWSVDGINAGAGSVGFTAGPNGFNPFPKSGRGFFSNLVAASAVPEPSSTALILIGLTGMFVRRRRIS